MINIVPLSMQKTILVVDDHPMVVDTIKHFFDKKKGYHVVGFAEAHLALGFLKSNFMVDLLIADLKMPGVSGSYIIEESLQRGIPYIVITSGIGVNLDELGYAKEDIFKKPFNLEALFTRVTQKLSGPAAYANQAPR